jgi:hypothetical protein
MVFYSFVIDHEMPLGYERPLCADTVEKSFRGGERKFLEPLVGVVPNDVTDHVASQKSDHGPSYRRYGGSPRRVVRKSAFARFLPSFDFRLLQQYPPMRVGHEYR